MTVPSLKVIFRLPAAVVFTALPLYWTSGCEYPEYWYCPSAGSLISQAEQCYILSHICKQSTLSWPKISILCCVSCDTLEKSHRGQTDMALPRHTWAYKLKGANWRVVTDLLKVDIAAVI